MFDVFMCVVQLVCLVGCEVLLVGVWYVVLLLGVWYVVLLDWNVETSLIQI